MQALIGKQGSIGVHQACKMGDSDFTVTSVDMVMWQETLFQFFQHFSS